MVRWILLAAALCAAGPALAGPAGNIRVIDGDTFDVGGTRVRLFGIDAPEKGEGCRLGGRDLDCGAWVTAEVRARFGGRRAVCDDRGPDRYGRTVARCEVRGQDVAREIVRAGLATAYRRYSRDYVSDERSAAAEGRGIFAAAPAAATPASAAAGTGGCRIKGNISKNGRIYHLPGQEFYDRTRISTRRGERWFCSEAEARAAGWRRARR